MNRVLVIGLDGATWKLLEPWMKQGYLPHLFKLEQQGSSGILRSTLPIVTSAAWSAFMTGKEPSNTGIFNFYYRDRGTYNIRVYTRLQVSGTSLWHQLSRHGKRSIVINVPMTYPAEEDISGFIITGLPTPSTASPGFTAPKDLFERFRLDRDQYPIRIRLPYYEGRYADLITDLKRMVREHFRVADVLIREPWDLFMVHFLATDLVQHALWKFIDSDHPQYNEQNASKYSNGLREVFCEVDTAIGELLQAVDFDQTTILVLSDHGFGPNHFTVHINQWLQKISMLKLRQPLDYLGGRISNVLASRAGLSPQGFPAKGLRSVASFPGYLLPASWQNFLYLNMKHFFKSDPRWSTFFDLRSYPAIFESLDWRGTRAYSVGTSGLIYINLKGREPHGVVSPGKEYEEVRNFIMNELLHLVDKKGKRVVDRVYRKEEIYHGKFLNDAPDLIPLSETSGCYFYPFLDREGIVTEAESFRSGNHRMDGIFVAKGRAILKNQRGTMAQIIDMAPTILYLLGLPIPRDLDGSVVKQILTLEYLENHPIQKVEPSGMLAATQEIVAEDQDKIARILKDLGYL
jgi:predicted AlkP superfamily phosphohydrolase/phosphomutase